MTTRPTETTRRKRYFGNVRKLPSGRWQARYTGPDDRVYSAKTPEGKPLTFQTKALADGWLAKVRADIERGTWVSPDRAKPVAPKMFREYADAWLPSRRVKGGRPLAVRTREHYEQLLQDHLYPTFGDVPVSDIEPSAVRAWHADMGEATGPTATAHAYGLLRTILNTALSDGLIAANPCRVRGAGQTTRRVKIRPATLAELETIASNVPVRYRLGIMLAAWCALRFGELAALRRRDIDLKNGVLHVRQGAVWTKSAGQMFKDPKSEAGRRDVHIPPHLIPMIKQHLQEHVVAEREALLFPAAGDLSRPMASSTLKRVYWPAREKAGRPDLRFHDLRHTGATLAAATRATLAELMQRLGHSTPAAAMRYQHATKDRAQAIANALSKLAAGEVVSINQAPSKRAENGKEATN